MAVKTQVPADSGYPPETHRNCSDCSRKWEKLKNSNKNWRSRIGGAGAKKTP